jgi:hypothetical protein
LSHSHFCNVFTFRLLSSDGRAGETRESSYKTILFLVTKALSLFHKFTLSPAVPSYLSHFIIHVNDIVADNFITCIISLPSNGEVKKSGAPRSVHRQRTKYYLNKHLEEYEVSNLVISPWKLRKQFITIHCAKEYQSRVNTFTWGKNEHFLQVTQSWNWILMHISRGGGYRTDQVAAREITAKDALFATERRYWMCIPLQRTQPKLLLRK